MPISIREYKEGTEPEDAELLAKFESKPYQAYTLAELLPQANDWLSTIVQASALQIRLNELAKKHLVKSKDIGGKRYFISVKAI